MKGQLVRKKLPVYAINGLPVLPDGLHWHVSMGIRASDPLTLTIQRGTASRGGYSGLSHPLASASIPERWHWRVRFAARRLYRKTFDADGNLIERKTKPTERFEDRYNPVTVFRSLHPEV